METRPILIVEDDAAIRDILLSTLADEGIPAIAVDNGLDALSAVRQREPALILLDLDLPVINGEGVLRALRSTGYDLPVLLMTADPRGAEFGPADGVDGHVPKPFNLDDLLAALTLLAPTPGSSPHA